MPKNPSRRKKAATSAAKRIRASKPSVLARQIGKLSDESLRTAFRSGKSKTRISAFASGEQFRQFRVDAMVKAERRRRLTARKKK